MVDMNPKQARLVGANAIALILAIQLIADAAQVFNSVVRSIAVNMVYLAIWPHPEVQEPCQSMAFDNRSANVDLHISANIKAFRFLPDLAGITT